MVVGYHTLDIEPMVHSMHKISDISGVEFQKS